MPYWNVSSRWKRNEKLCYVISQIILRRLCIWFCCSALFTLLLFLHAVVKFIVIYGTVASSTDSGNHLEIVQSLHHWPIRYKILFLVPTSMERRPSLSCLLRFVIIFQLIFTFKQLFCWATKSSQSFNAWRLRIRCFEKASNLIFYSFENSCFLLFSL